MTAKYNDGRGPWWNIRKGPETAKREGYKLGCYRCGRTGHIWRFCTAKHAVDGKEIPEDWNSDKKNSDDKDKKDEKDEKTSIAYVVNESLNDAQAWY